MENTAPNPQPDDPFPAARMRVQTIDTGGGANVAGDVNLGHGDFVGRDKLTYVGYTAEQVAILIAQIRRDDQPKRWDGRTPYIGLTSFREHRANLFFGREKLVAHLLTRVKESRLLCITGPSGSGKSSLVQAGLIPALRAGKLTDSDQWLFETLTPGNQPLENLASAVGRMAKSPAAADYVRSHGASDPAALHAQAETLLSHYRDQRVILVVDQFEEIFTQTKDEPVRLVFLDLLTYAVQQADGRVSVLLAMRSDFVSQCATYAELRQLLSGRLELVGAMEPEELTRAIALPALEVGVEVKPDLVAQVITDMRGEPGALPLMQFALKDLFDAQPKQPGGPVVLTFQEYLAHGGIQQALERHANAQFALFSPEEERIARKIFMSLIEVGRGTVDTRRTAVFSELLPAGVDANQVEKVVQTLADARLITTDSRLPVGETPIAEDARNVTLAHEKLIEAWPWLQQLVRENRVLIELQNQISEDATQWVENKHDASYLYTGARLQTAQEQLAANQLTLSALAQQLIDASVQAEDNRLQAIEAERQRELEHERALAEEQRQRANDREQANTRLRNRARWLAGVGLLALLLAAAAGWFGIESNHNAITADKERAIAQAASTAALEQQATAEAERAIAQRNADIALSRQLAAQSGQEVSRGNYDLAIPLAIESGRISQTKESFEAIRRAAFGLQMRTSLMLSPPNTGGGIAAVWSADESRILTRDYNKTARVWDDNGRQISVLEGVFYTEDTVTWSPIGNRILHRHLGKLVGIFDADSGRLLTTFEGHTGEVNGAEWNANATRVLTYSNDGTARVWDSKNGKPLVILEGHEGGIDGADWNLDESRILTYGQDGTVRIWTTDTGKQLVQFGGHNGPVIHAVWSADESRILSYGADHIIRIWNPETDSQPVELVGHVGAIREAIWNKDGSRILTSAQDGRGEDDTVRVWDSNSGDELIRISGLNMTYGRATWNADESRIVTKELFTVRFWDAASGELLSVLLESSSNIFTEWTADRSRILIGYDLGRFGIWDAMSGEQLMAFNGHEGWNATGMYWSTDESRVLTSSQDGTAHIWSSDFEMPPLLGYTRPVREMEWSATDNRILTAGEDGIVRIWNTDSAQLLVSFEAGSSTVDTDWSADESRIFTYDHDGTTSIWDARTGKQLFMLGGYDGPGGASSSADESRILTYSLDGTARIWDVESGDLLFELESEACEKPDHSWCWRYRAIWNSGGHSVLTYGDRDAARVYNAHDGTLRYELKDHTGEIWQAKWNAAGSHILTFGEEGIVRIWDAGNGKERLALAGHIEGIWGAGWNAGENRILSSDNNGHAYIWDANTGEQLFELKGYPGDTKQARWSANGRHILALAGGALRIWSADTGKILSVLEGFTGSINVVQWNADESRILISNPEASNSDSLTYIWDTKSGKPLMVLEGGNGTWSKDESHVLVSSKDGMVLRYYTSMEVLIHAACKRIPRNLSRSEWSNFIGDVPYQQTCDTRPAHPSITQPLLDTARELAQTGDIQGAIVNMTKR